MSSERGPASTGKRLRNASITPLVSSTERVVWVRYATFPGSATSTVPASCSSPTRWIARGASPIVPMTSSWPSWPMSTMSYPLPANLRASWWTLVTSGRVAASSTCRGAGKSGIGRLDMGPILEPRPQRARNRRQEAGRARSTGRSRLAGVGALALELRVVQLRVQPARGEQLVVATPLDDAPLVDDEDAVGLADGG